MTAVAALMRMHGASSPRPDVLPDGGVTQATYPQSALLEQRAGGGDAAAGADNTMDDAAGAVFDGAIEPSAMLGRAAFDPLWG